MSELEAARVKPVFATPDEAIAALARDKLGTIYYKAAGVFVACNTGTGTFTWPEWRKAQGYLPSVARE